MEDCIFCQIAAGKIPAQLIYENDHVVAFLDNQPKSTGHTLIIPKKHFVSLLDIPTGLLSSTVENIQEIARIINIKLKPDGFNLCQNNGLIAGQTINHLHFHIIPRYQKLPLIDKKNLKKIAQLLKRQ